MDGGRWTVPKKRWKGRKAGWLEGWKSVKTAVKLKGMREEEN